MKDKISEEQAQAALKALEEAIAKGPWDASNFLRVIGKNLADLRDEFVATIAANKTFVAKESPLAASPTLIAGQKEIFIALYCAEGNSLSGWEKILSNLPQHMISRAIYVNELEVEQLIRSRPNKINEAYISAYIKETDILVLPKEKVPKDKFGKELIVLKDKVLQIENMHRFVHLSGRYRYTKGRLIKIS